MVLLGHGFMRDLTHMRGWAQLWASYGVPTAIMSFCNSSFAAGHHDRNAEDMAALAAELHNGPVIYAGFSAGGLAALIAASRDPRAAGYLGLDPVDSGGLAAPAAARLALPALFLEGEPSSCNAQGNMAPIVPARRGAGVAAVRVLHSVHCMFEDPSDAACASVCGSVEPEDARRDVSDTIHAIATAWILHAAGIDTQAGGVLDSLWAGGDAWERRIVLLQAPGQ
jgi:pimeloyl-ACP methyl ester carboxylesterase